MNEKLYSFIYKMAAQLNITKITTSQEIDPNFSAYLVDASAGHMSLTLPDITYDGLWLLFRRVDTVVTNFVIISGYTPSQTIEGAASVPLPVGGEGATVSFNGVWKRI